MTAGALVLLVNDIPDHLAGYERALAEHGFRVAIARSGREALIVADRAEPECAVIDLRLPDMSGWDLCGRLKCDGGRDSIRVIMLTPDVSRTCAAEAAKAGCHAWLTYALAGEDLVRTIRHVLDLQTTEPTSEEEALLGRTPCPACDSYEIRPTLRVGAIQYYCCRHCSFCWRVEALQSAS